MQVLPFHGTPADNITCTCFEKQFSLWPSLRNGIDDLLILTIHNILTPVLVNFSSVVVFISELDMFPVFTSKSNNKKSSSRFKLLFYLTGLLKVVIVILLVSYALISSLFFKNKSTHRSLISYLFHSEQLFVGIWLYFGYHKKVCPGSKKTCLLIIVGKKEQEHRIRKGGHCQPCRAQLD